MLLYIFIIIYLFLVVSYVYSQQKNIHQVNQKLNSIPYRRQVRLYSDEPNPNF